MTPQPMTVSVTTPADPPGTAALRGAVRQRIRVVPDFPEPGIQFQDLTPVFGDPELVRRLAATFTAAFSGAFDRVLAIEARGFVLGTAVAAAADRPLVLARKKGKLPGPVHRADYALEYGTATLEIQRDALAPGDRVLVVDDVLATGGTFAAAGALVADGGATVAGYAVAASIAGLDGAARLAPDRVFSLLTTAD
ncbi:adenine phosphoribosyltransferase [Streptomyces noursei]|uniref:adenine phosphoribosyltransferase n=1 Tax=Streptomyces noursei TaxID=1971 RepID=UPI0023B7A1C7|nr:adenine phosphoribosyltransferase [Streptomyces noursei]